MRLHLLAIGDRTVRHTRTPDSRHFRALRRYPPFPRTFGEHLRKKRIDLCLSMTQLAEVLGVGVTDSAIEKWEKDQNRPTEEHLKRLIDFIGYAPITARPTGGR